MINETKDENRPAPLVITEDAPEQGSPSNWGGFILAPFHYMTRRTPSAQPPGAMVMESPILEPIVEEPHPAQHITPQSSPNFSSASEQKLEMEELRLDNSLEGIQEQTDTLEPEVEIHAPTEEDANVHILTMLQRQREEAQKQLDEERQLRIEAEVRAQQFEQNFKVVAEAHAVLIAQRAMDQLRINLEVQRREEDARVTARRERAAVQAREAEATRQEAIRLAEENDARIRLLLQQQERQRAVDAQAAQERREAESRAVFAASSSTGAPTLEEHSKKIEKTARNFGF